MSDADLPFAKQIITARCWAVRGHQAGSYRAEICLDRDALSLREWLTRRGRRLLDRPSHLHLEAVPCLFRTSA